MADPPQNPVPSIVGISYFPRTINLFRRSTALEIKKRAVGSTGSAVSCGPSDYCFSGQAFSACDEDVCVLLLETSAAVALGTVCYVRAEMAEIAFGLNQEGCNELRKLVFSQLCFALPLSLQYFTEFTPNQYHEAGAGLRSGEKENLSVM